jgi:hypothetical protein
VSTKRLVASAVLAAAFVCQYSGSARGQDVVEYLDPAAKPEHKPVQVRGLIESETPLGIKLRPREGPVLNIAAADIRYVRYKAVAVPDIDYRKPFSLEDRALGQTRDEQRRKLLADALQAYRDLLPGAKETPAGYRYLQYRIARLLAQQAEDDRDKLDAAIAAFAEFARQHADSWEIVAAHKQLAHLQEEKGDLAAAGEAYSELARTPGLATRTQQESQILAARMLLRAGRTADAEKRLADLDTHLSDGAPSKPAVRVFLAQCRMARGDLDGIDKQVQAALAATADEAILAAAHNLLGDYYLKKGQPEDAFWHYLRVDVQYGSDREEDAKALYYLSQLFDKVKNDRVRARDCLTRLQDKGQFGGTEYHKRALAAKP